MVSVESGKKLEKKKGKKAVKDGVKKKVKERLMKKGGAETKKSVTFVDDTPSVDSLISEIRGQVDEQQKTEDDSTPVELETLLAEEEQEDVAEGHSELLEKFGVKERKRAPKEKTLPMEPTGMEIDGKVTLNELLVSASKQQNLASVQQLLDSGKDLTTLAEPLPRFQQEQAERIVNYDKTKKEVSKWQSLVKRNRETEHMSFPLFHVQETRQQKQDITTFATKRKNMRSELEEEIYEVLEKDAHVLEREGQMLTEAEEQTLEELTVEEAEARRQELCKMRALLSYQEEKLRRQNKIKSKKYRRVLKKEKQKKDEKELAEALKADPEAVAGDEQEKADYLRALERISQKHKVGGKWNKNLLHKKIRDPDLKSAMAEQRQMRQNLMEKKADEESSEEEEGEGENKDGVEDKQERPVVEEKFEIDPDNPWLMVGQAMEKLDTPVVPPPAATVIETPKTSSSPATQPTFVVGILDQMEKKGEEDQEALVDMAFANDDVVAQFVEEKAQIVDQETEKDVDLTLPGWGSWGGAGVAPPKKPQKKFIKKAKITGPRKDAGLSHVIISTKKNRKLDSHLVRHLPHPYKNRSTFEREMRQPIGPQWNSVKAFRNMIKPSETILDGHVIEPISVPKGFDKVPRRTRKAR